MHHYTNSVEILPELVSEFPKNFPGTTPEILPKCVVKFHINYTMDFEESDFFRDDTGIHSGMS